MEVKNVMEGKSEKEGVKKDEEKLMWNLLPVEEVEDIVKVLTYGAKKYAPGNWMNVKPPIERYYAALMRHLVAWRKGEDVDPESGLSHLSHACCCLLFLMWHDKRENI